MEMLDDHGHFPGKLSLSGTANTDLSLLREEGPICVTKMSWAQDIIGESTDVLKCSCSQNTFKNERLEHLSYRQERNFIDKDRQRGETHSMVWKPGAPMCWSSGYI
jgi:hypothetical protein